MKLALLGKDISHSLSPSIYQRLLGRELTSYDLLDFATAKDIPSIEALGQKLDGLNITSPYKKHFAIDVEITSDIAAKIGAINAISFGKVIKGTNTDALATEMILKEYMEKFPSLRVILLGGGVMAQMTTLILDKLNCSYQNLSRLNDGDLTHFDLRDYYSRSFKTLVINSCSRSFQFKGILHPEFLFWDYNYNYPPHSESIPAQVSSYEDGKRMLELQAQEAIKFWKQN